MKILFITPHGGYTGSEMLIWQLLQELTRRDKQVAWFARNQGTLQNHVADVSFPAFFYPQKHSFVNSIYEGIYLKVNQKLPVNRALLQYHKQQKPDLWYLNTGVMPDVAALAQQVGIPYVVHMHELTSAFDEYRSDSFLAMLSGAEKIIGCAGIVQRRMQQLGFSTTELMYSCIDHERIRIRRSASEMRQQMGIPDGAFVWMMSGTASLRKGYDLIPDLLNHLPDHVYVCWLGKPRDSALRTYVEKRVVDERLNYRALNEQSDDYFDYLNAADGFVLTSREDPFPLVMIEAAALGKPIAAFNSGGASEFILPGMGDVIDSLNPADLARSMEAIRLGKCLTSSSVSQARAAAFSMSRQADDFCRILQF